jgi:hypothetical protein
MSNNLLGWKVSADKECYLLDRSLDLYLFIAPKYSLAESLE